MSLECILAIRSLKNMQFLQTLTVICGKKGISGRTVHCALVATKSDIFYLSNINTCWTIRCITVFFSLAFSALIFLDPWAEPRHAREAGPGTGGKEQSGMKRSPRPGQGGHWPEAMALEEVEGSSAGDSAVLNVVSEMQDPEAQNSGSGTLTNVTGMSSLEAWGLVMMSLLGVTPTSK
jgi:hypothetical protein